jgi:hypothetical protein
MKMISVTLLLIAALTLLSCQQPTATPKAIADGFTCVTPLSADQLRKGQLDPAIYDPTPSGTYVPKGWQVLSTGKYQGCYVPLPGHPADTTIVPKGGSTP